MFVTVWKFVVRPDRIAEFERHYGPEGSWARLFRQSQGYVRTELFRGAGREYITIDYWENADLYQSFRKAHAAEYARLDTETEALSEREEAIVSV